MFMKVAILIVEKENVLHSVNRDIKCTKDFRFFLLVLSGCCTVTYCVKEQVYWCIAPIHLFFLSIH